MGPASAISAFHWPVPVKGIFSVGLTGSLELISRVALFDPGDVGLKVTLKVELLPGLIVLLPPPPVNIDASVPVIDAAIVRLLLPLFVTVKEALLLLFTLTFPYSYDVGLTEMMGALALIPVPLNATTTGLLWFVALCVIERLAEAAPAIVGENFTVTVTDCPGDRLNAPPPLTIEKGAERVPTLPVRAAVELD